MGGLDRNVSEPECLVKRTRVGEGGIYGTMVADTFLSAHASRVSRMPPADFVNSLLMNRQMPDSDAGILNSDDDSIENCGARSDTRATS